MKFVYLLSAFALTLTVGCNNQPAPAEETKVVETETTRVVEVEAPAKEVPATKVVVEAEKGTSIKIGPEGGSLKTKGVDIDLNK